MERLLNYFVPEKYILELKIDKIAKTIGGIVTVTGDVVGETVKFHAEKLDITKVLVDSKESEFNTDGEILEIKNVALGKVEIEIHYNGMLNENMEGAYLSYYEYEGKKETIVATQFESHYARQAFPCIDEPAAKAVFELTITLPEGSDDIVLMNMPAGEPTPRMSTYLLAWVIGRFHGKTVKNAHGTEITTYCALNQDVNSVDFANEVAARSLEFYDDNFGVPYPLTKLDQVALPDFEAGAMENWGLVTYRESMLLVSDSATLGAKKGVALTVAHELSHQWFGNLVTMQWWDDLWLNESFATAMEYFAVDATYPEFKIFEGFFTGDCYAALMRDAYTDVQSVHQDVSEPAEIATLFDSAIVYAKGARLMLMVIRLMGWDNFCQAIREYFEKFQYGNTIGDDLWETLKSHADFDPRKLMHAFIDKPGYPVVTNQGGNFKEFSQRRFLLDGPMPEESWPLPEITEDMSGHYVLNLSEEEFNERLAKFDELKLEEKLRILIDRDLITKSGLQSAASLVDLMPRFKSENRAAIWLLVSGLLANLKIYFDHESEGEKLLKKYTLSLVDEKLSEIGIETGVDDDENTIRLRANLMGLDYFAEDEARFRELVKLYKDDATKIDKEIREDVLDAKVYLEPEMSEVFVEKYKTTFDPDVKFDYLKAATLVRDEEYLAKVLKLLGDTEIVKPQDQLYLFIYLYRNPKAKARTFEWLTKNWELVKQSGGEKTLSDYPMFVARLARTEEELMKYIDFFGPMRNNPALARAIEIGEKEIKARVKLISEHREEVLEVLRQQVEKRK